MSLVLHITPIASSLPVLGLHLALGFALGLVYFKLVWGSARQLAGGGRTSVSVGLIVLRLGTLAAVLVITSLEGAGPLLATALGILVARPIVMRRHREAIS